MNTYFEFFINGNNQNYVAANGDVSFGAGKIVSQELGEEGKAAYVTVAEAFIPAAAYGPGGDPNRKLSPIAAKVPDFIRVGFAWKTNDDLATDLGGSGGGPDAWWFEEAHFPNNHEEQYYISSNGIHYSNPLL